jgi:uncharacterized repeat protein (TIGR01451 family)
MRLQLIGSNTKAEVTGVDPLPGKSNYLTGSDPATWHTDVPTYAKVRYSDVYPGIDLVYYGNQEGRLEHDFVVAPGADPTAIAIGLYGSDAIVPDQNGGLTLHSKTTNLTLSRPVAYQTIGGKRRTIPATYLLAGSQIKFQLGSYDRSTALVIDPVLVFTSVFGGTYLNDLANAMTIDKSRNIYVTGSTVSYDFPLVDPFQSDPGTLWISSTEAVPTVFVSKLNSTGTALLYSTYLGRPNSQANAIAVDDAGRIYLAGSTTGDFPVVNAYQPTFGGGGFADAFIAVLNPAGNALDWSTFMGGSGTDVAVAMALDSSNNVYVTGITDGGFPALHSIDPPATPGIWVAKFDSSGVLQYSGVFAAMGPLNEDPGSSEAIAVDSQGSAYVTGYIRGPYLPPTTSGAYLSTCPGGGGNQCAFVSKLSPAGDSLIYSTTMGPNVIDAGAIALDSDLNAYIGGCTGPGGMPTWNHGFQHQFAGGQYDGYVAKLNANGTDLIWSTYLGGSGDDCVGSLAIDQYRTVYVAGTTSSADFPLQNPIQTYNGTTQDPNRGFVTTLSGSLGSIPYFSTYFGESAWYSFGLTVDPSLNIYLAGTNTGNMQSTPGAYTAGAGVNRVVISKLAIMDDLAIAMSASSPSVAPGEALVYTISVTSKGPDFGTNVRISDMLPAGTNLVSINCGGGSFSGTSTTPNCVLPRLDKGATWTVYFAVIVYAPAGTTLSNTATTVSNMQDFVPANNSAMITTKVD